MTIQSGMLVLLGFFTAALFGFLLAPFYRRRAERLATDALKSTMPLTSAEIRADKDRLRAEFAITIHKLEAKLENANYAAARQLVEINRRDAAISALESEVSQMRTFLDEHENARRVLEQTIMERLPRVEARLAEAKSLLSQRDKELAELTFSSRRHSQALEEATQINTQQRDEIHRLNATLTMYSARNRESLNDPRFDPEVGLRVEIEGLRAKTRDQSALISRLQAALAKSGLTLADGSDAIAIGTEGTAGANSASEAELIRLRKDLAEAEMALRSVKGAAEADQASVAHSETDLRNLKSLTRDQAAEIANLKAALRAFENGHADEKAIKESKIALKARLSALQAQADEQSATIQALRTEVAAANEKLARQAAHYMDEMRRLGAGTIPVTGPQRRSPFDAPRRSSLSERISAPRAVRDPVSVGASAPLSDHASPSIAAEPEKPGSLWKLLGGSPGHAASQAGNGTVAAEAAAAEPEAAKSGGPAPANEGDQASESAKPARRPGLLERITGLEKQA